MFPIRAYLNALNLGVNGIFKLWSWPFYLIQDIHDMMLVLQSPLLMSLPRWSVLLLALTFYILHACGMGRRVGQRNGRWRAGGRRRIRLMLLLGLLLSLLFPWFHELFLLFFFIWGDNRVELNFFFLSVVCELNFCFEWFLDEGVVRFDVFLWFSFLEMLWGLWMVCMICFC